LSSSDLLLGSPGEELWSQGALKIACMELRSEHACTTAVQSTEAITTMATREKGRFDMSLLFTASE
jgi:hypothetical protein